MVDRRWRSLLALAMLSAGCTAIASPAPPSGFTPTPAPRLTVVAAGNICGDPAACRDTSERVAEADPDLVLTLGDMAYDDGLLSQFRDEYGGGARPQTGWGRPEIKAITLPGFGNHDCYDAGTKLGCDGAVSYFGTDRSFGTDIPGTTGSYWTVRGDWLIVVLNSAGEGGSGHATPDEIASQGAALVAILEADDHTCEIVAWHHPRFTSGRQGRDGSLVAPWFETAYANGVDVILNAHHHHYERFAPQDPSGQPGGEGVREFVVGTGGAPLESFGTPAANSEARFSEWGILTMELGDDGTYSWAFLDDMTAGVFDEGADVCH